LACGEESSEVRIRGDDDATFDIGALQDLGVGRSLHVVVAHVGRVVAGRAQSLGEVRRQGVVDQELHATVLIGSSRSRTASAAYLSASTRLLAGLAGHVGGYLAAIK
jgi:endonuclease/exonuclease/phosphatase family metal-dependent hydrolase